MPETREPQRTLNAILGLVGMIAAFGLLQLIILVGILTAVLGK